MKKRLLMSSCLLLPLWIIACAEPQLASTDDDDDSSQSDDDDDDDDDDDSDADSSSSDEADEDDDDDASTSSGEGSEEEVSSSADDEDDDDVSDETGDESESSNSDASTSDNDDSSVEESSGGSDDDDDDGDADNDGDGLSNDEEKMLGTDPNDADTDKDTYWDSWEVAEKTDPLDKESRIYQGYWPYNPKKDELESVDVGGASPQQGKPYARIKLLDQFGDSFDLYDMSAPSKAIGIDISAVWCGPCNSLADYLTNGNSDWEYESLRTKLHSGEIRWITILAQDADSSQPTQATLSAWAAKYPDELAPVLADDGEKVAGVYANFYPTVDALEASMTISRHPPNSNEYTVALDYLNSL
jgi:hypothetical protein